MNSHYIRVTAAAYGAIAEGVLRLRTSAAADVRTLINPSAAADVRTLIRTSAVADVRSRPLRAADGGEGRRVNPGPADCACANPPYLLDEAISSPTTFEGACHASYVVETICRGGARSFGHGTGSRRVPAIRGTGH